MKKEISDPLKDIVKNIEKINELKELGDIVTDSKDTKLNTDVDFKYNKWTVYKLMLHMLYLPLYTSIISKNFAEFYYVDLFAGSGVGYLSKEELKEEFIESGFERDVVSKIDDVKIGGSTSIAIYFATEPFAKYIFVEKDMRKCDLLKKRANLLCQISQQQHTKWPHSYCLDVKNIEIRCGDANTEVNKIVNKLERRNAELLDEQERGIHAYFFIDPEGMEFKRDSFQRILNSKFRKDIIMLFNSYAAGMQAYNVIYKGYKDDALKECLGKDYYGYIEDEARKRNKRVNELSRSDLSEILSDYYVNVIKGMRRNGRNVYLCEKVTLQLAKKSQQFDIIVVTSNTRNSAPYLNAIRYIDDVFIRKGGENDYQYLNAAIYYIVTGKLPGLLSAFIKNPEEILSRYRTLKKSKESRGIKR
jgi:three-Cys-motif partner protein